MIHSYFGPWRRPHRVTHRALLRPTHLEDACAGQCQSQDKCVANAQPPCGGDTTHTAGKVLGASIARKDLPVPQVAPDELRLLSRDIFVAAGVPPESGRQVADSLVDA